VVLAIVLSVSLAVVQLVVLKMLPFDNKSEFQVVLDMPVGTPVERTAEVLREIGEALAGVDEVTDFQAYAGTAAPINFNGLVRQYYLRAQPEMGDIQVNLVDKHQRSRKSHEVAISVRDTVAAIAKKHGGNAKVVEVPPGPPVLSPIVAEVYGPDYAGQVAVARQVRQAFEATADIVGVDDTVDEEAPKLVLRVNQAKAARLGCGPGGHRRGGASGAGRRERDACARWRQQVRDPGAPQRCRRSSCHRSGRSCR
jgi:multidrug efflux pump subunit AcrB